MAYVNIFVKKKKCAFSKVPHIFFSKNTCDLDIVVTRTANILTTNELVKLTMLWTTGPRKLQTLSFLLKNGYLAINWELYPNSTYPFIFWKFYTVC